MDMIIEIANSLIEVMIVLFFFGRMLNPKQRGLKQGLILAGVTAVHIIRSFIFVPIYVNMVLTLSLWMVLLIFLYDDTLFKKLVVLFIYIVVALLSDILYRLILSYALNIDYAIDPLAGIQRYTAMIVNNFLCFAIYAVISMFSKNKRNNLTNKYRIMMLLFPVFSLFIVISTDLFLVISKTHEIKYLIMFFLIVCGLIYFNIMVFEFIDTYSAKLELDVAQKLIKQQSDSYKMLEVNESELRQLKHNIKEHMETMKELLRNNSAGGSDEFLNSLNKLSSSVTGVSYTADSTLDAVLNAESRKAAEQNIKYVVKTHRLNAPVNIEAVDKSIILGNAIDNAIEACQHLDEKFVVIDIAADYSRIKIRIENSSMPIDVKAGFKTSKKDSVNHGFGIKSIKNSLRKYNGIYDLTYDDGITVCQILMDNPKAS